MFFSNATIGVFANRFGGWKAVIVCCFLFGIIEVLGSAWAIHLIAQYGVNFNAWMGMADWALVFPPIFAGLSATKLFFWVLIFLAVVYMFCASKELRTAEAKAKDLGITLDQLDGFGAAETNESTTASNKPEENTTTSQVNTMTKPVRILAVCGNGQGSSMMMKMKIKAYLDKQGIPNIMDSCAISDYKAKLANIDIIVSSKHLYGEMEVPEGKSILGVQNMLNPASFGKELIALINEHQKNN